jgi:pilus assembly protein Flp/PilA
MLASLTRGALAFLKREDGPTTVEYAILLALIVMVCVTSVAGMGSNSNKSFGRAGSALNTGS